MDCGFVIVDSEVELIILGHGDESRACERTSKGKYNSNVRSASAKLFESKNAAEIQM